MVRLYLMFPKAEGVARMRDRLSTQTRQNFAAEVRNLTPAEAANLIALIDASTSPEAYDLMGAAHGRSARQIGRTWVRGLEVILAGWCDTPVDGKDRQAAVPIQTGIGKSERGAATQYSITVNSSTAIFQAQ